MNQRVFKCETCQATFERIEDETWSDAKAIAEYEANFPEFEPVGESALICDDCYQKFMKWLAEQGG